MSFVVPDGARLVRALGSGTVFEVALVERDGRRCICKRLRVRWLEEPQALQAFERACGVLERLKHPAVPVLIERGNDARGPYMLQTEMEGVSLRALREGHRKGAPAGLWIAVARAAFDALAQLHALGDAEGPLDWVHGDLGPDHVLVSASPGRVGFADFGMSSLRGIAASHGERGTLPYVAPEVARGEAPPDQSGDVFALAASFAYAVLGRDPCRSADAAARLVEVGERGLDLAALSAERRREPLLVATLERALAFDRAARLSRAREVLAALSAG